MLVLLQRVLFREMILRTLKQATYKSLLLYDLCCVLKITAVVDLETPFIPCSLHAPLSRRNWEILQPQQTAL